MQWGGLYRERNSIGNGMNIHSREKEKKEKTKTCCNKINLDF